MSSLDTQRPDCQVVTAADVENCLVPRRTLYSRTPVSAPWSTAVTDNVLQPSSPFVVFGRTPALPLHQVSTDTAACFADFWAPAVTPHGQTDMRRNRVVVYLKSVA